MQGCGGCRSGGVLLVGLSQSWQGDGEGRLYAWRSCSSCRNPANTLCEIAPMSQTFRSLGGQYD